MKQVAKSGYGLKHDKLIHISEVVKGIACGCICVSCKAPLVAKKGLQRTHHFAHAIDSDCSGAAETALHLLSKELFLAMREMYIPTYEFFKQKKTKSGMVVTHEEKVAKGGRVAISKAHIEQPESGFTPDVILDCEGKKLIIEIAVTHKVNRLKLRNIRRRNLPAIEIRLEYSDALLSKIELNAKLQNDLKSKVWLFHPLQREAEGKFLLKLRDTIKSNNRSARTVLSKEKHTKPKQYNPQQLTYSLGEYEKASADFYKAHKRYPSMEECIRLWPRLWKK